jgi:6-phosphogluconolactonase
MLEIVDCKNYDEMSLKAAEIISGKLNSGKRPFSIAISGGTSVKGLLEKMSDSKIDWFGVNIFMADERIVDMQSQESNYFQADNLLFSKIKKANAYKFDPSKGINDYNKKFLEITKGKLDLAVLGVGEDCHIASLFPGSKAIKYKKDGYVYVGNSPKPPKQRITLSAQTISNADSILLLFASDSKLSAYKKFLSSNETKETCPAKIALSAKQTIALTVFGGVNAK